MTTLANRVYDNGLTVLDTEANRIDITSQEATTYAEATSTYTLGNSTSLAFGAPQDGDTSGRKVTASAITNGTVTGTGNATHYAISDTVNSRLLVTATLNQAQQVYSGNDFNLAAIDVELPDPA